MLRELPDPGERPAEGQLGARSTKKEALPRLHAHKEGREPGVLEAEEERRRTTRARGRVRDEGRGEEKDEKKEDTEDAKSRLPVRTSSLNKLK